MFSIRPPRDHVTCPFKTKQASDTWQLLEPLTGSAYLIQILSGSYS